MRVLACNPDTIGDVLLRQPLYAALSAAGHELCLVVRPLVEPLVAQVAPGARVLSCSADLYGPEASFESPQWQDIITQARHFQPDLILVAPYQWTSLEERLSVELSEVPVVALTGKRFADPNHGRADTARLRITRPVPATEDIAETSKNELLASAVLGRQVSLPSPALAASPEHLGAADAVLARLGLEPGQFWIACVGDTEFTQVRNWEPERWAEVLVRWAEQFGRRFLLIGHTSEEPTNRLIANLVSSRSDCISSWSGDGAGDLSTMVGLVARSAGYVGRDTGPMHMAAALDKPVLAVFGGGTWPRFLPAAKRSVSITVSVPCTGCGWVCHLPRSHCIKDVPVAEVLRAAADLESGRVNTRESRVLKPDNTILASIGRGGADVARSRQAELSILRREQKLDPQSLTVALEQAMKKAARAEVLAEEIEQLRAESARREAVLRQRLAAAQNTASAREADLRGRLEIAEKKLQDAEECSPERLEKLTNAYLDRERELRSRLSAALSELTQRQTSESDLKLRLERLESDRRMLGSLTHQQEVELAVLRQRIHDLASSRWRKYGQRLGLCMTLPWESATNNGKH